MVTYILSILMFVPLISYLEAEKDVEKWYTQGKRIEHKLSSLYRGLAGLVACTIEYLTDFGFWPTFFSFFSMGFLYWLLFDLFTNKLSNRHLLSIGTSSSIDKLSSNKKFMITLKITLFTVSTVLTITTYLCRLLIQ